MIMTPEDYDRATEIQNDLATIDERIAYLEAFKAKVVAAESGEFVVNFFPDQNGDNLVVDLTQKQAVVNFLTELVTYLTGQKTVLQTEFASL